MSTEFDDWKKFREMVRNDGDYLRCGFWVRVQWGVVFVAE